MPRDLRGWHAGRKSDHKVCGRSENFRPRREKKGADRREVRRHAALGADCRPDGQELRGRERFEIYKIR